MALARLTIENLRCLAKVDIEPDPGLNLCLGENASGKTSLLEAIFFLGRGRSFRSPRRQAAIRDGEPSARVVARLADGRNLGFEITAEGWGARVGGQPVESLAELAGLLPVQLLDPDIHRLVQEGPGERRRYLDWATFHVKPEFLDAWRHYQRAMKQRNAALRRGSPDPALVPWEEAMVEAGARIDHLRRTTLAVLEPPVARAAAALLEATLTMTYRPGHEKPLAEALAASRERDRRTGVTQVGPHRADLSVELGDRRARGRVSRGQQKLLAAALVLGQAEFLAPAWRGRGVLLVDDPAAELDSGRATRLLERIGTLPFQVFLTGLDAAPLAALGGRRFHVKQGRVLAMV